MQHCANVPWILEKLPRGNQKVKNCLQGEFFFHVFPILNMWMNLNMSIKEYEKTGLFDDEGG